MLRIALPALAVLALAACEPTTGAPTGPTADDPLAGSWKIYSIGGVKTVDPLATEMTFVGLQTVSGTFGCNRFTGNYTYERNVLFISNVTSTKMACGGAPDRQERHGMRLLTMPMTAVPYANTAILSGREGQSFALSRDGSASGSPGALPSR